MRTCRNVEFAVLADPRVRLKEYKNRDNYLDLARELKELWNRKVMIICIIIGSLYTYSKLLVQELENFEITGRVETVQTISLLKSARILRGVLET